MANVRPPLSEIIEMILGDGDALLEGVDARIDHTPESVILIAQAGAIHAAEGRIQRIADDAFLSSAKTPERIEQHCGEYGIVRGGATFAQGWVGEVGPIPSEEIPIGTVFRRADGREYERVDVGIDENGDPVSTGTAAVDDTVVGLGGVGWVVPVIARESGADGNTIAGASITFVQPIGTISPVISVRIALAGAVDIEPIETLRKRGLKRKQNPPQGGTKAEYEQWALDASTDQDPITRTWAFPPAAGSNVVTVYIVNDGGALPSAQPPTPSAQAITNAEAAIDAKRPLSAARNVIAPTFVAMGLAVTLSPNTPELQAAIDKEVDAWLIDNHEPEQEIPLSIIRAVISNAAAGGDAEVTAPAGNFIPGVAELFYRGAIVYS